MLFYLARKRMARETTTNKPGEPPRNSRTFLDIFRANIPSADQLVTRLVLSVISRFNFPLEKQRSDGSHSKAPAGKHITAFRYYRTNRLITRWLNHFLQRNDVIRDPDEIAISGGV